MHTKIVYTLVSSGQDWYLEQLMMSVWSLRLYEPEAEVVLVVDEQTDCGLTGGRSAIRNMVNHVVVVRTPDGYSAMQRSRYLKTTLRKHVQGDYLFVDCDTIICGPLHQIDDISAELAMVADENGELTLGRTDLVARCLNATGVNLTGEPYYNSGVILAKDTAAVHEFYAQWHKNWLESDGRGVGFDQPALCLTNMQKSHPICELEAKWNCQFKMQGYPYLEEALVMHYYANNGANPDHFGLPMEMLYDSIRRAGAITPVVGRLIRSAKEDFAAVAMVNRETAMDYFNNHLLYLYINRPRLYRLIERLVSRLEKLLY